MNISGFDYSLLLVFQTIYSSKSISQAAGLLHLSQPAVSHALNRLRQHFDDPLFERSGKSMLPTSFARQLMQELESPLKQLKTTVERGPSFDPGTSEQTFVLGLREVFEADLMPRLLSLLQNRAPGIKIKSVRAERKTMLQQMARGELDLVLDVPLSISGLKQQHLLSDNWQVVTSPGRTALSAEDYLSARHILVSSRPQGPGLEDFALTHLGIEREIGLRCQHYFAAYNIACHSDMLLTMPQRYAQTLNQFLPTRQFPLPFNLDEIKIMMYWHPARDEDLDHLWLREQIFSLMKAGVNMDQELKNSNND